MINKKDNPVEWYVRLMELEEIKEHIESLVTQMSKDDAIDEEDFRVQLFHAMTHLNRLWNSRHYSGEINQELHDEFSKTPGDFQAIG
ncbi:hypothetical protein [Gynuella sunshinyii]|uniref:Uncharacterized protein n=1 Tax=Gynuella sunshinyii YC6258 TaxID=1445510 RepID=A0A0C5VJC5_9GAMM|nr:hypothetical protein [Gynuella sunshinyii]AJQ94732.1 hypothetical Protein YC6258_02694 [Gynuella sunshinyii YC6258]